MQLQKLLTEDFGNLTPRALIVVNDDDHYTAQKVYYAPEILNLGVVLLGYYSNSTKVSKLSRLGDCLSVAHYLRAPRTLKYGRDFANNPKFKGLPAKLQKHLTGEIQDCTMAFTRDFNLKRPAQKFSDLTECTTLRTVPYAYLYQDDKWWLLKNNGHKETEPVSLQKMISQLLRKKA